MQRSSARPQRRWRVTGLADVFIPYDPDEPIPLFGERLAGARYLTSSQIARASKLPVELIRKRLTRRQLRDWPSLSRTPEQAKAQQVRQHKMRLKGEAEAAIDEPARRQQLAMARTMRAR